jgi:oligosaccharyltransferase complex subunit beta
VALSAEATAYSHDPKKAMHEPPSLPVGGTAALVSLVQVGTVALGFSLSK